MNNQCHFNEIAIKSNKKQLKIKDNQWKINEEPMKDQWKICEKTI